MTLPLRRIFRSSFLLAAVALFSTGLRAQNPLFIPDTLSGKVFDLTVDESTHQFIKGVNTNTYGINSSYLGPVVFLQQGDSVVLNVHNQLADTTTMHWHGLHVPAGMDGGPHQMIPPGTTWSPTFKVMDRASVFWFHSHLHMETEKQVMLGDASMLIVRDSQEAKLNLPRTYGKDDFPLILQDRRFDGSWQIVTNAAFGDSVVINGTLSPYLDVPAQVVRFRVLNGNNERVYNLGFADGRSFYQIGSDGGLLSAPVSLTRLMLAPGERAELLVDFSTGQGDSVYLMAYNKNLPTGVPGFESAGPLANALGNKDFNLLKFRIGAQTANPVTSIPSALATHNPWTASQAKLTRTLNFTGTPPAPFLINNTPYDMDVDNYRVALGNIEIWQLVNQTTIAHPFHIHDIQFYILSRNGAAPSASESGLKDVVLVKPNETVKFITQFNDFANPNLPYMYHCHILPHEDAGMMGQFVVVDSSSATGLLPQQASGLRVYPNPTSGQLKLESANGGLKSVCVHNSLGQQVMAQNFSDSEQEASLDLSVLPAGVYAITLQAVGQPAQVFRVIRQ